MRRLDFLLKNIKPGKILDIGNLDKQGKIHEIIIEKFPESEIHGIDILDQQSLGLNFPNQKIGKIEEFEYPENYFDTVYMGQVLEHSWTPKQLIDKIYKIIRPGGVLVMDMPNVYSLSRILRYVVTGKDIILGNEEHKIFYSRAMIENLVLSSGFVIKEIKTENVFAFKGKLFPFPRIGRLRDYGECLMVLAQKIN